jgi:hypothetical protein
MQTGKARIIPVVNVGSATWEYWEVWMRFISDRLLKSGLISRKISLFSTSRTTSVKPSQQF